MVESDMPCLTRLIEGDPNEEVCGHKKSKYFAHTRKKALVIAVSDYSELREEWEEKNQER